MISKENFFKQENVYWSFYLRYLHLVRFLFLLHVTDYMSLVIVLSFFLLFRLVITIRTSPIIHLVYGILHEQCLQFFSGLL